MRSCIVDKNNEGGPYLAQQRGASTWWALPPTRSAMCAAISLLLVSFVAHASPPETGKTIGLVLTEWRHALHETPEGTECPDGLALSEREQHKAGPDSDERLRKFGFNLHRGPNGEHSAYFPWLVEDPLPVRELQTTVGYGLNLDGTSDGAATPRTCAHEKFIDPQGEPVDNQLARVVGCTEGWRNGGFMDEFWRQEIISFPLNRILFEIRGVDDEMNDPGVEVWIYKGKDGLMQGAGGGFAAFQNHRIDERYTRYMHHTRGRIVDGVLITEPIEKGYLPIYWIAKPGERLLRDLQLRLKLSETGAEGILGGYEDLKIWWNSHSKGIGGTASSVGKFSNPTYYREVHRYADGYPDAETGQCTAISAAYKIKTVRALIAHPKHHPGALTVSR